MELLLLDRGVLHNSSVYKSDDNMEGAALSYVLYSNAIMEQGWSGDWEPVLSACAREEPQSPDDPRFFYFNRAVLGYNLNLKYWVAMELNYNSVTEAEHSKITASLRIEQSD